MKTVFLDRDGVINENRADHVKSWDEFVFLPGALASLRRLRAAGWRVIVVTNQAIIHRHIVPQAVVEDINGRMLATVETAGGAIDAVLYCPHDPAEGCDCRKPKPGLLIQAAQSFNLRLSECYLVGDAFSDIAAGQAAGCATVLVRTGRGRQQLASPAAHEFRRYQVAPDLPNAVSWLIWAERRRALRQRLFPRWPLPNAPQARLTQPWLTNSDST
ncbi:MAG: D-glycero-beta-D-manno-heptose 1,7-bisphosphate 7-phosphatase [Anaerolineae bacterium]